MTAPDDHILARLIAEHVCDGILLTDPEGRVVWLNPAFARISGYSLEELRGRRPGDVLQGQETSEESRRILAEAIATRTFCRVDIVNYSKTGVRYISEVNLSPILDDDGTLLYFVAVQRDVTEERALTQRSADFDAYRAALDRQAIVSVTDARGKILYVNAKFTAISGYEPEELVGRTHRTVNSGIHDRTFFREMWATIRRGDTWHGEVCNRTKSGALYWVDTTVVPVHGPRGEIVRYVSTRYDITDRKLAETELRRLAETDTLTGLANRTSFAAALEARLAGAQSGLVVMFDLDRFKDLNDTMGHRHGDLALRGIGRRLARLAAPGALFARLGGDEFAGILPDGCLGEDDETALAALHLALSEDLPLGETVYAPSFSMGARRFPGQSDTVENLMMDADIALHEAKRAGRNRWCFFDPATRADLEYRERLKGVLARAVAQDSFEIALQPVVAVEDGAHRGFEVLVRLREAGRFVPPDHFVPLAEELGLIVPIGKSVMRMALRAHRSLREAGLAPGTFGINVAAQQIREPDFVESVQDLLFEYAIAPTDLVIEITETALIGRATDVVADTLSALQRLGIRIALDDFGTGFSSISHLKDFHVDKIKIDKSFVQDLERDENDRALVDGLIGLGRRLGLSVVAEGVETEAHLAYLRRFGCQEAQGYLFARPLSLADAERRLREARACAGAA